MDLPIFINKRIFWETRLEDIDLQAHKNFVIPRVFEWGHLAELKALLKYYSREEIVYGLTIQKYLSKRTLQFASALLNLPKEDFACYSPTPSHRMPGLFKRLMEIPEFNHFYLVGGTGLSLKYGHRLSIDIDLFSSLDFDNNELEKCIRFYFMEIPGISVTHLPFGIFCHLDEVKVDFMKWGDEWIDNPEIIDEIRIASDKDIFPMKLEAAMKRGAKKDFIDLALLIHKHGLPNGLEWYHKKFPYNDEMIPLKSLTDFERAEDETTPILLNSDPWPVCKQTIIEAVRKIIEEN